MIERFDRVLRWCISFRVIGRGATPTQLNKPVDLAFDKYGNLYVLDMENNRVQMFELIDNRPCER